MDHGEVIGGAAEFDQPSDAGLARFLPSTEPDTLELSGVLKFFDIIKRYGFIVPDNDLPDVLLPIAALRASGFQTVYSGVRMSFEARQGPKGLLCTRIIAVDESTAIRTDQVLGEHVTLASTSGPERAMCKWFNHTRGYGFLTRGAGTPDIFIHAKTLRACGFAGLEPGQAVLVRYGQWPKGLIAAEVFPG